MNIVIFQVNWMEQLHINKEPILLSRCVAYIIIKEKNYIKLKII